MAEAELPKQELLLKILKMTTSDNDNTALIAIRKANQFLLDNKWDWDKLIAGKIKVVADPFAGVNTAFKNVNKPPPNVSTPPNYAQQAAPRAQAHAQHQARAQTQAKPQPASPPPPPKPLSTKPNIFPQHCYCCGIAVPAQAGFTFDPANHNSRAKSKWQVLCKACVTTGANSIYPNPAPRKAAPQATPNLNDL